MDSHSAACHTIQVDAPRRNLIYLPWIDGRLSWPRWLVIYRDSLPICNRHPS